MRTIKKALGVEALELRDVPAMFVPILSPGVTVATPDHTHAAAFRQYVDVDSWALGEAPGSAARVGPIIGTRSAVTIIPILDPVFADGNASFQDFHFKW